MTFTNCNDTIQITVITEEGMWTIAIYRDLNGNVESRNLVKHDDWDSIERLTEGLKLEMDTFKHNKAELYAQRVFHGDA